MFGVWLCFTLSVSKSFLRLGLVLVVGGLLVGNPHEPRGGTCAPGVRRAACLSEGPACSTGWAFFKFFGCLALEK